MTKTRRVVLALAALVAVVVAPVEAAEGDETVVIKLREIGTYRGSEGYGPSDVTASGGAGLAIGETASVYIARAEAACSRASGSGDAARKRELIATNEHVWWADVRPVATEVGKVTIDVDWAHYVRDPGETQERTVAGDSRRITMEEGERHVLDFLDAGPEAACRSTLIDVTASIREDPALENELLGYDLWYRHTEADGGVTSRRFQAAGRQGEELDFRFTPLRFAVPGAVLDDGTGVDAILEVMGALRGRVRPDGSIDVRLGATRWVDAEKAGTPRRGGIGGGGTKVFSVLAGETVSMVLPAPGGRNGVSVTTTVKTQGAEVKSDSTEVWVDNKEFFAGHQDELILTVTRER